MGDSSVTQAGARAAALALVGRGGQPMFDDLVGQTPGELLQVIEPPRERAHTHRERAQIDDEIVKLGLWQVSIDLVPALPTLLGAEAQNLAAAAADEAMHARGEVAGDGDLHRAYRLE